MLEPGLRENLQSLHPDSFAWAVACCRGDREEAEDVLQMTYLKVLDGRACYGGRSTFKTWLFGVIRRTAAERRRRRRLRQWLLHRWAGREPSPAASTGPQARLLDAEQRKRVTRALAVLSQRQRQVLELVFYHDLSVREAAEVMEVSLGSARVHYDRGKKALLQALEGGLAR